MGFRKYLTPNRLLISTLFCFVSLTFALPISADEVKPITSLRCNQFTFDASGSYDPDDENISYFWDFGDGQTSEEAINKHVYAKSGIYDVTLSIADNSGLECSTAKIAQKVLVNLAPKAEFSAKNEACVNDPIEFNGSASSDDNTQKLSYDWNFGDGTKEINKALVQKSYAKGGDYKVILTVDDNTGSVCTADKTEKIIHINEAPVAEAGEETILRCISDDNELSVSFDATNSYDINNDQLTYQWEFGDGATSTEMRATHTYSDVGVYDAKLIVKDTSTLGCGVGVDFVRVRVNKAPKANAGDDIIACPREKISFDGSNSFIHQKGTVNAEWMFGDGASAKGLINSHVYDKPGQYQATLTIANELNAMCPTSHDTRNVSVNAAPSVSIKTIESACLGNEIHFDASSATDPDGDDLEYYWSFGDGTILKSSAKVSHKYEQGGNYRVTVIVDDKKASNCSTATTETFVKINTPPVADAGPNLACCINKSTQFTAQASSDPDGDNLNYFWDLGDGTKKEGLNVTHAYEKNGAYNVTLTVDDATGTACSVSTAGFIAEVNSKPVPVIDIR